MGIQGSPGSTGGADMAHAARHHETSHTATPDGLVIDEESREVFLDHSLIEVTRSEFDLLAMLARNPRRVLTPEALLSGLWHTPHISDESSIEVYISRLRKKLGESAQKPRFIVTVRGVGYRFEPAGRSWGPVEILYDDHLIVQLITPGDREFLGWKPRELIGTPFKITQFGESLDGAYLLRLARAAATQGLDYIHEPRVIRAADGREVIADVIMQLLVGPDSTFHGLRMIVQPWHHA